MRFVAAVVLVVWGAFGLGAGGEGRQAPVASALPAPLKASLGSTIYVSPAGSNSNPGTLKKPKRTIQAALNQVRAGQRILVRAGLYEESLVVHESGTASRPITLRSFPGERAVVRPRRNGDDTYGARITGSYVRVSHFVFEGATGMSSANVYVNDASHIELRNNIIRSSQDQGIFTDRRTSDVQIIGNVVHDNGAGLEDQHQSHGMYLQGERHLVANNVVYDHPYGFGIHVYPDNDGTIVTGNTVAYSGWSGIVIGGDDVRNITVRNNIFAYNARYGIASDEEGLDDSVVDTNLMFANKWGSIQPNFGGADFSGGNRTAPPSFRSARTRDFRLTRRSPAIDHALPAYSKAADLNGVRRPQGRAPDIGAFEWVQA